MLIEFKSGKIIVTPHELVVRIEGAHLVTMQAQTDAIQLIGKGANVVSANAGDCKWSIKLDNDAQLKAIGDAIGAPIL